MTKIHLYSLAAVILLSSANSAEARERSKILWKKDLTEAFNEATKTGKPIVIFFRRDTSEPLSEGHNGEVLESMHYERDVLSDRMVQSHAKDTLFVKLMPADLKPGSYEEKIAKSLKIEQYPVLVVLEISNGQLLLRGTAKGATNFREKYYPVLNAFIAALHNTDSYKKSQNAPPSKPSTTAPSSDKTVPLPDIKPSSK